MVGSLVISAVPKPRTVKGAIKLIAEMAVVDSPTAVTGYIRAAKVQKTKPSAEVTTDVDTSAAALRSRKFRLCRCVSSPEVFILAAQLGCASGGACTDCGSSRMCCTSTISTAAAS